MKKLLLLFIPFLLLAGGIGGYIFWYNLPFQQIERALQAEDYETVAEGRLQNFAPLAKQSISGYFVKPVNVPYYPF